MIIKYKGQLGNNIFQYAVASLFAKKYNYKLDKPNFIKSLNMNFITGEKSNNQNNQLIINDNNFMYYLEGDIIDNKKFVFDGYFQKKEFVIKYYDYLENLFNNQNTKKNGFLIHARIDEKNLPQCTRGVFNYDYYAKRIEFILKENNKLNDNYIITDSPQSPIINKLIKNYDIELYHRNQYDDLLFSLNFDNLILSEGSYSFWLAVMSKANNVICFDNVPCWHGDIFVNKNWEKI